MARRRSEPIPTWRRRPLRRRDHREQAVVASLRDGRQRPEAPVVVVVTGEPGPDREAAVASAAAQRSPGLLVVVVDAVDPCPAGDCPGDLLDAIGWGAAQRCDRALVRHLTVPAPLHEVNLHRNVAIRLTASRYVGFLDAGARWRGDHLERSLAALEGDAEGGVEVAVARVRRGAFGSDAVPDGVRAVPDGLAAVEPAFHPAPWGPGSPPDLAAVVTRRVRALRLAPPGPGGTAAAELGLCRRLSARLHVALLDAATVCRSA